MARTAERIGQVNPPITMIRDSKHSRNKEINKVNIYNKCSVRKNKVEWIMKMGTKI